MDSMELELDRNNLPHHVGIIMDGNGRWATEKGLKRSAGHKAGAETLKKLCNHIYDLGIPVLSVYAFSTENFKRAQEEVDYLMNLFIEMFQREFSFLKEKNIKVVFSGRKVNLSDKVLKAMDKITNETKDNTRGIFNVCLNYGGQYEILDMVEKIIDKYKVGEIMRITEGTLAPVTCLECDAKPCERVAQCRTLGMWTKLHNMITGYLDSVTLADLMQAETADHYII